jgi:hypothetical protein
VQRTLVTPLLFAGVAKEIEREGTLVIRGTLKQLRMA